MNNTEHKDDLATVYEWEENLAYGDYEPENEEPPQTPAEVPLEAPRGDKRKASDDYAQHDLDEPAPKRIRRENNSEELLDGVESGYADDADAEFEDEAESMLTNTGCLPYDDGTKQEDKLNRERAKLCYFFSRGRACKRGQKCLAVHDVEVREENISRASEQMVEVLRKAEEAKASRESGEDPEFAVLVSGYEEIGMLAYEMLTNGFAQYEPMYFEWSSQFSKEEREKLEDRYSLPTDFVRIAFSTVENQRNAIVGKNRKRLGYKGPALLVQRYIAEKSSLSAMKDGSVVLGADTLHERITTKAEEFHRKKQCEEELRNRSIRFSNPESGLDVGRITRWMIEADWETVIDNQEDNGSRSGAGSESGRPAPQLVEDEEEEKSGSTERAEWDIAVYD